MKSEPKRKRDKRLPPLSLYPLTLDQAVKGLLALSPEDAKAVREAVKKPAKKKKR